MAKQSEKKRDLMIQRVNLTEGILNHWEGLLKRTLQLPAHKFLLYVSDIHNIFEVEQDETIRRFSVEGMTDEDFIILKEYREEGDTHWLCKHEYVQYLLKRFNNSVEYTETTDKKTKTITSEVKLTKKDYKDSQLYLPNKVVKSKRENTGEIDKTLEKDVTGFLFDDDDAEDVKIDIDLDDDDSSDYVDPMELNFREEE